MKLKATLLIMLTCAFIGLNAQVIFDFEDGSTPLGAIAGAVEDNQQTEFVVGADNPDKSGINTSNKCLYILSNQLIDEDPLVGRPTWNGNIFTITLDDTVKITDDNRYLKIMHHKEQVLNNWLIYGAKGDTVYAELGRGTVAEAGAWVDLVVDVASKLDSLRFIRVHLDGNWTVPAPGRFYAPTKFYYDNIELSSDLTPRDLADVEFITKTNLLDFEDIDVQAATASPTTQNAAYTIDSAYVNEESTGLNTTTKCLYWTANDNAPAWWHGILFNFTKPVNSGANKYLHLMMKKDVVEAKNVTVSLVNTSGAQSGNFLNVPVSDKWVDYVFEIPASHAIFTQMYIKWNASANVGCFADEIIISTDPQPRVATATKMNSQAISSFELYQNQGSIIFNSMEEKDIQIYSISGKLIYKQRTKSLSFDTQQSGVYIIKVNSEVRKLIVN